MKVMKIINWIGFLLAGPFFMVIMVYVIRSYQYLATVLRIEDHDVAFLFAIFGSFITAGAIISLFITYCSE